MRGMKAPMAYCVGGMLLMGLGVAASASADTLPGSKQAKALERAFARDHRHPRDASIVDMRVSTVDPHWALIQWMTPPHRTSGARDARGSKIIDGSYFHGPLDDPKPAPKPSKHAVVIDLGKAVSLKITYAGSGTETATATDSKTMSCGGPTGKARWKDTLNDSFSWSSTIEVNLDEPLPNSERFGGKGNHLQAAGFPAKVIEPTDGTATDTYRSKYTDSTGCTDNSNSTKTYKYEGLNRTIPPEMYIGTGEDWPLGVWLRAPFACTGTDCASDPSRWSGSEDLIAVVPLKVGFGGVGANNLGPFKVKFPYDVPRADGIQTSHSKGLCAIDSTFNCTDTVMWSGTVKTEVVRP